MKRFFKKYRDDRFALTTLQNPNIEVRTYAQLVQAADRERERQQRIAQQEREWQARAAQCAAPQAPDPPIAPEIQPEVAAQVEPVVEPNAESAPPPAPNTESVTPQAAVWPEGSASAVGTLSPKRKSRRTKKSKRARGSKRRRKTSPDAASDRAANKLAGFLVRAAELDSLPAATNQEIAPAGDEAPKDPEENDEPEENDDEDEYDDPALSPHERHSRKCVICHHPDRVGIEEHFLNWRNADLIRKQDGLNDFRPIYRHARATGLMERRRENLRFAADLIIENADQVVPTAEGVLRAIRVSARLNDKGQWVEPPSHVIVSSGGRIATPQFGPLPQISMTQVVLPPQTPPIESAAPPQPGAANHSHEEIPDPSAPILGEEMHPNLIGHAAIKNRRNPMKINGALPF